jgi:uncharacterized membrane protein YsdA (DUF1294 family)
MLGIAVGYLLIINLCAFASFWADKRAAEEGRYRISERTLLMLAAMGGTSGAIAAQQILRHKTHKEPFRTFLLLIAGGQILLTAWLYARTVAAR